MTPTPQCLAKQIMGCSRSVLYATAASNLKGKTLPVSGSHAIALLSQPPLVKLHLDGLVWGVVLALLHWRRLPKQIAGALQRIFPRDAARHVSHSHLHRDLRPAEGRTACRQLIACLRQGRGTCLPRTRGVDRPGQIPEMVSIHVRPPETEDRVMPGH